MEMAVLSKLLMMASDGHQLLKKWFNYNYFFNYFVVVKLSS